MSGIDLNLLLIFDTVYEQRSVTRTADRLGMTQSAVSHALRRLREALDDPLFVRAGRTLQPTARATGMAAAVRDALRQLQGALAVEAFDPGTAQRSITIAAGPYFCALIVPRLIAIAKAGAPGIVLRIVPIDDGLLVALDEGLVDLALGAFQRLPDRVVTAPLYREDLVWIAAAGSAHSGRRIGRDALLALPRLQVGPPRPFGLPEALLAAGGLMTRPISDTIGHRTGDDRHVHGQVYDAATAVATVARTDLVALVPRRVAEAEGAAAGVVILDVDEPRATLDLAMLWHRSRDKDPGLAWLRAQIVALEDRG